MAALCLIAAASSSGSVPTGAAPRRNAAARIGGAAVAPFQTFITGWARNVRPTAVDAGQQPSTDWVKRMPAIGAAERGRLDDRKQASRVTPVIVPVDPVDQAGVPEPLQVHAAVDAGDQVVLG